MTCHRCQGALEFNVSSSSYQCPACAKEEERQRAPMPRMNIKPLFVRDRTTQNLLYTDVRRFCVCGHEYETVRVEGPGSFDLNNPKIMKMINKGCEDHASMCFTVEGNEWLAPDWYLKTLEEDDD